MSLRNKKALVYDLGLFTENAARFARDFAEVKYYSPWEEAFAEPFKLKIGEGIEGIERVETFWDHVDEADMIFLPDTTCAHITEFLKAHDYPAAGAGAAEKIELDRWYGRQMQKKNELPVQQTDRVKGISALVKFCKENKNFYIKVDNSFRGISESFKHQDFKSSEARIDYIAYKVGPYKEDVVFICEELLPGVEPGYDGITFDGELLYPTMAGYERKGVGYIGRVYRAKSDFPEALGEIHEGLSSEFEKLKTRFFYSVEVKIDKDRIPYLLDPTIRLAAPGVAAVQTELIENYSEVVYGLATGEKVLPIMKYKYAVAAAMNSDEAAKTFVNVSFPKDLRQWVKLRMAIRHKGDYYSVPPLDSLGTVIALGNTIKETVETVKERAKQVDALGLSMKLGQLDEMQEDIETGRKYEIGF